MNPSKTLLRPRPWRATRGESARRLPGDDIIARPYLTVTRAVAIKAPPTAVWPWLAGADGCAVAGWFCYGDLGPEPGELRVGDMLLAGRTGSAYRVEHVERGRAIVIALSAPHASISQSIVLLAAGNGTRLLFRMRVRWHHGLLGLLSLLLSEARCLVGAKRHLYAVKRLAQAHRPAAFSQEDRTEGDVPSRCRRTSHPTS